jgi:hypothetical protein
LNSAGAGPISSGTQPDCGLAGAPIQARVGRRRHKPHIPDLWVGDAPPIRAEDGYLTVCARRIERVVVRLGFAHLPADGFGVGTQVEGAGDVGLLLSAADCSTG